MPNASSWCLRTIPEAAPLASAVADRLRHVVDIGLGYLSLDRPTDTLSGGESQRIKIDEEAFKKDEAEKAIAEIEARMTSGLCSIPARFVVYLKRSTAMATGGSKTRQFLIDLSSPWS